MSSAQVQRELNLANGDQYQDERNEVWAKLQTIQGEYLNPMTELYGLMTTWCNRPMAAEQLRKVKQYKALLRRMIPYLLVSQDRLPKEFNKEKAEAFEKQIVTIYETFKKRKKRNEGWAKLQTIQGEYLNPMTELYELLTARSSQPMEAEQLRKLKHYKAVLRRMIPYLRVSEDRLPKEFNKEKAEAFEKQIVMIYETFRKRSRQGRVNP